MRWVRLVERLRARLARGQEGQAAVEYAISASYLLVATLLATPFIVKFAPEMLNAFQIYVDGFYFCFSLPFP